MDTYEELVFKNIESFSPILNGSVLDMAKGIYADLDMTNMYPSNAALTCINLAYRALYDKSLHDLWNDIIYVLQTSDLRKRKPTRGKKLYLNIQTKSEAFGSTVDLEKHKKTTEVIFSGSKIVKG